MKLIESTGIDLRGKHAVVIGRSNTVGKPMALMLLQADATVTVCHSRTPDLAAHTRQADVVVAAVGRAQTVTADMVKPGAVVIDVGMNRDDRAGKLCGDVDFAAVARGRRRDHAGAGRRRADDDRDAARQHRRCRRAAPPPRTSRLIARVAGLAKL